MSNYSHATMGRPIRTLQDELVPQVPNIAPLLYEDPKIMQRHIAERLDAQGFDPGRVAWVDRSKAERTIYSAFAIGRLKDVLVQGTGPTARYREFPSPPQATDAGLLQLFHQATYRKQVQAAQEVEWDLRQENKGAYWDGMARRYAYLGWTALARQPVAFAIKPNRNSLLWKITVPREGLSLRAGLRSEALTDAMYSYLYGIRHGTTKGTRQRTQMARDLRGVVTRVASGHFLELPDSQIMPPKTVLKLEGYGWAPAAEVRERKQRNYHLPSVTTKCPAHTIPDTGLTPGQQDNRDRDPASTYLEDLIYAQINQAREYGVL